ncbi:MAG: CoA-binding protein [Anaerolineae bacterium]|nr:CoA-binding protein [Anaerolineae bacterium]
MPLLMDDNDLRDLLRNARVIAVVGHSDNPERTSYQIAAYLRRAGYRVIPVNPTVDEIDGDKSYPTLADIPERVDIVDVFRRAEHLAGIVEEAAAIRAGAVWGQLEVASEEAALAAETTGLPLVMDRCIKIEHRRLIAGQEG